MPINYKKFRLVPFFDESFGDFGVDITDQKPPMENLDSITGAESRAEAVEWAKEVCDNRRLFEKDGFIL